MQTSSGTIPEAILKTSTQSDLCEADVVARISVSLWYNKPNKSVLGFGELWNRHPEDLIWEIPCEVSSPVWLVHISDQSELKDSISKLN